MNFSTQIINWYKFNKRDLPWRETTDPYRIWLSEIILQQTRVAQGMAYYLRFVAAFPEIRDLAAASEEQVLKLWQGLGYYSRARNLHSTAKFVVNECDGVFPNLHNEIIKLKGIGEYTAAAIASFSFSLPYAVVDGNVYRVLSRFFGIETPIDTSLGRKEYYELAQTLLNKEYPAEHNQAIMEFGALQCVPSNPDCCNCPLTISCVGFNKNLVNKLPVKSKKGKQSNRYFNYFFIKHQTSTYLNKRIHDDIWKNLFDFPSVESDEPINDFLKLDFLKNIFQNSANPVISVSKVYKHILSHQKIYAQFCFLEIDVISDYSKSFLGDYIKVPLSELDKFPIPRLIEKYLEEILY